MAEEDEYGPLPEMYQHWKGGYYLLMRIAQWHDGGEPMALYRPVSGDESALYVRPLKEFNGIVEGGAPRFRVLSSEEGEQVALDRMREQFERAREEANSNDPQEKIVLDMTESLLIKLQQNLNERLADGSS